MDKWLINIIDIIEINLQNIKVSFYLNMSYK